MHLVSYLNRYTAEWISSGVWLSTHGNIRWWKIFKNDCSHIPTGWHISSSTIVYHLTSVLRWQSSMWVLSSRLCWVFGRDTCFFQHLRLSMEHHEQFSIDASPPSDVCFCFEPGLMWQAQIHTHYDQNSNPGSHNCVPMRYHLAIPWPVWLPQV